MRFAVAVPHRADRGRLVKRIARVFTELIPFVLIGMWIAAEIRRDEIEAAVYFTGALVIFALERGR